MSIRSVNVGLRFANFLGFILALYAYNVETSKERDPSYTAMCDINEHMSCSKVFTSKYGRGFGLIAYFAGENSILNQPNCLGGMIFFFLFFVLSFWNTVAVSKLLFRLSIGSVVCCVYLAYILYFVLHDFCVVCVSTYVVNIVNLVLCAVKLKMLQDLQTHSSTRVKKD